MISDGKESAHYSLVVSPVFYSLSWFEFCVCLLIVYFVKTGVNCALDACINPVGLKRYRGESVVSTTKNTIINTLTAKIVAYPCRFFFTVFAVIIIRVKRTVGGALTFSAYDRRRIGCTCNRLRKGHDGCPNRMDRRDSRRCHTRTMSSLGGVVFHNIDKEST